MIPSTTVSPRSRTVTLILNLLIFAGLAGLHRVYTGRIISGAIQFLTMGLLGIWQLIDLIRILIGTYSDAQGRSVNEW